GGSRWPRRTRAAVRASATADRFAPLWADLRAAAEDAVRDGPPPLRFREFAAFRERGDRLGYERPYFARRRQLAALALTVLVDERPEQATALNDLVWAVCDEHTWALPAHLTPDDAPAAHTRCVDLFAAETAHALAEVTRLLSPALHPEVTARAHAEIRRRVVEPMLEPRSQPWESWRHNWSAVCGGAVGMTALALLDDERERAALLARATRAQEVFLSGFGADGACTEGVGYWSYGFGYFVYFAETLRDHTGQDLLTGAHGDHVRRIAEFPAAAWLGGGHFANFADSPEEPALPAGLLCRLRQRRVARSLPPLTTPPRLEDDPCYRWAPLTRTLCWATDEAFAGPAGHPATTRGGGPAAATSGPTTDGAVVPDDACGDPPERTTETGREGGGRGDAGEVPGRATGETTGAPGPVVTEAGTWFLPAAQWITDRRPVLGVPVAFAAKGGHNDEPHNHNDLGHFLLHVGGESLLADLGSPEYTRDYFGPGRYRVLHASSEGHSVPLLDDTGQLPGAERRAVVLHHEQRRDGVRLTLDLTSAYDHPALLALHRDLDWRHTEDGGRLLLTDTVEMAGDCAVTETFVSRHRVRTGTDPTEPAHWRGRHGRVGLRVPSGRSWTVDDDEVRTVEHDGSPGVARRLHLTTTLPPGIHDLPVEFTVVVDRAGTPR
ncbi:heparinase II/III domain-containing protein, partial [Actinoalloteichus caeruleus]|uniref:heparinase II/III domain-containing protein n=1 Tax=Actinoalloteichus cyanogriseus TaxID=2893586 RepID=UPI001B80BCE8